MLTRRVVVSSWSPHHEGDVVDLGSIASALQDLVHDDPSEAVLEESDRTTALVLSKAATATRPLRLQLLALRDSDSRPIQFSPGSPLSDLQVADGAFAGDVTHVCIWPDGTAAQDWYRDVPRLSRLAEFLRLKLGVRLQFSPVYDKALQDALDDIQGQYRSAEFSMNTHHKDTSDRGAFGSLIPAVFGEKASSVTVKVGVGRYGPRDKFLPPDVEESVLAAVTRADALLDNLVITGRSKSTGKRVEINLLKNRLGTEVSLKRSAEDSNRPDETDAYRVIRKTVEDFRKNKKLASSTTADIKANSVAS